MRSSRISNSLDHLSGKKAVNESQLKDTLVSLYNQTTNIYFTGKYTYFYVAT